METFLATIFVIICLLLIGVVLLQKGRGGGLSSAFGGGGGGGTAAFGTRTGDVLTWITIVLTGLFLLVTIASAYAFRDPPGTLATPVITNTVDGPDMKASILPGVSGRKDRTVKIHYTLDGSEPTEQSPIYKNESLTVHQGATLKAKAFRKRWKASETGVLNNPAPASTTAPATLPTSAPVASASAGE